MQLNAKDIKIINNNKKFENKSDNSNNDKCIVFTSVDQKIIVGIACSGNSTFAEVEEKLYQEYPEYRETNNTFISNGNTILRFKTINQNKIENGRPIILYQSI